MIIGIDVSAVVYDTGVSDYTLNLVKNLLKIDRLNTYKLFFSSFRQPIPEALKKLSENPNVKLYSFKFPPTLLEIFWNRLHFLPIEWFIGKCDIFHTWDWTQPPTLKAKTVTTVHDLVPFLYPENQHPKTINTFKRKFYWATRECRHFICVSRNTQSDLLRLFPHLAPNHTSVIYEAAEDKYTDFLKLSPADQFQKKKQINCLYGLDKFILVQGTREPRKNLKRLIDAFITFRRHYPNSKVEMAITGKYGWGEDIPQTGNPWIKVLGFIPEKDLVALHASALFLAYPSLYEGFGLPLVKSMKVGVPVLTSATSSLPEITGRGGLLVDPNSTEAIAEGLEKLINSPALRSRLSRKALLQSSLFFWSKTAKETLNVYQKI
ncbi:MAG: glycosyltransferase family 1 protein [Patescibacteria group bacterium]